MGCWVIKTLADGFQLTFVNKRFISLNIDNDIPVSTNFFDSFFYAVSTALMILARHNSFTAKCFYSIENSLIVCCNIGCF
ncbi:Uncharacterised protein [Segatella copri]|nr:Uncharacterised protein [Segatella copri]